MEAGSPPNTETTTITMTGAMARKIGRISSLYPDADLRIVMPDDSDEYIHVEVLDEYGSGRSVSAMTGQRLERGFVVRESGRSNPPLSRARAERNAQ